MNTARLAVVFFSLSGLAACASPEAARTRGGGPGADVGNRQQPVEIHAGADPYWETPKLIESERSAVAAAPNTTGSPANDGPRG
jgi:hypothetical protein